MNVLLSVRFACVLPLAMLVCSCEPIAVAWASNSKHAATMWGTTRVEGNNVVILGIMESSVEDIVPDPAPVFLDAVALDGFISVPTWSPDDQHLAYYRYEGAKIQTPDGASTQRGNGAGGRGMVDAELVIWRADTRESRVLTTVRWTAQSADASNVRNLPTPAWSKDSRCVFYSSMCEEQGGYWIKTIGLDGMMQKDVMPSDDGRVWGSIMQSTIATLSDGRIVLYDTEKDTRRHVSVSGTTDGALIRFASDLSAAAILSKEYVILVHLTSGKEQRIPNEDDIGAIIDIALSSNGSRLYYLVETRQLLEPSRPAYQVRYADIHSDKRVTLYTCPNTGKPTILSVPPDEQNVFVVMQHAPSGGKSGFSLVGNAGKIKIKMEMSTSITVTPPSSK